MNIIEHSDNSLWVLTLTKAKSFSMSEERLYIYLIFYYLLTLPPSMVFIPFLIFNATSILLSPNREHRYYVPDLFIHWLRDMLSLNMSMTSQM